jgi:hypothetical protein
MNDYIDTTHAGAKPVSGEEVRMEEVDSERLEVIQPRAVADEGDNVVTVAKKSFGKVSTKESSRASDEDVHWVKSAFSSGGIFLYTPVGRNKW